MIPNRPPPFGIAADLFLFNQPEIEILLELGIHTLPANVEDASELDNGLLLVCHGGSVDYPGLAFTHSIAAMPSAKIVAQSTVPLLSLGDLGWDDWLWQQLIN